MKGLYIIPVILLLWGCKTTSPQVAVEPSIAKEAKPEVARVVQPYVLLENFEDGDTQNRKLGYWYTINDNGDGGKSRLKQVNWETEAFSSTGGYENSGMLNVDVILEKAGYQWSPYFAFVTQIGKFKSLNTSDYDGLSYWHKGVGHTFKIETEEVGDYDFYMTTVPASEEWTLVTIEFDMMNQEGWGRSVDLNLDNPVRLQWNVNTTSGNFQLDEIQFVRDIKYEKQNDMKILPAEIPAATAVKGNVNTPLNDLCKKYLTKGMNFDSWGESKKITSTNTATWKYNEKTIIQQKNQGFLGIRFPIDFDLYIVDREAVLNGTKKEIEIEPMLWTVLDSMNVWTKRHDMSLTIDFHAYDGTYTRAASKDQTYRLAMASLWRVIAEYYVDEKREDLFYELTNEPGLSLPDGEFIDSKDWTILAQMMIDSIRTVDPTRPLIFGDVNWYSIDELIKNKPLDDDNIIYCIHMYDPFLFSHQGASWTNMGTMRDVPFPYSPERWSTEYRDFGIIDATPDWVKERAQNYYKMGNKQHIKNRVALAKNWAFDHNVPLICNEWGALKNTAKLEDLNAYFDVMAEVFEEMDVAWQVWFGVFDTDKNLLPGMQEALDLTPRK